MIECVFVCDQHNRRLCYDTFWDNAFVCMCT